MRQDLVHAGAKIVIADTLDTHAMRPDSTKFSYSLACETLQWNGYKGDITRTNSKIVQNFCDRYLRDADKRPSSPADYKRLAEQYRFQLKLEMTQHADKQGLDRYVPLAIETTNDHGDKVQASDQLFADQ